MSEMSSLSQNGAWGMCLKKLKIISRFSQELRLTFQIDAKLLTIKYKLEIDFLLKYLIESHT